MKNKPASIPSLFPNRKLGMQNARSDADSAHDTQAWAWVALANMRPGDRLPVGHSVATVLGINDKTLRIQLDGRNRVLQRDAPSLEQLVRDLGSRLLGAAHGAKQDMSDVLSALQRDPGFRLGGPTWRLEDPAECIERGAAVERVDHSAGLTCVANHL